METKQLSKKRQKTLIIILLAITLIVLICQAQPVLVYALRGVDGSFGLRPKTHGCMGISLDPNNSIIRRLPQGDLRFRLFQFSFAYRVTDPDNSREYCLGQDIWFGD